MMDIYMFISSIIICWGLMYVGSFLLGRKISYKSKKFLLLYLIFVIYMVISYIATGNFVRVILNFIVLSFILSKLHKLPFVQGILLSFIVASYTFISEIIFVLIVSIIFKLTAQDIQTLYFAQVFSNFSIVLLMILLSRIKILNKVSNNIVSNFDKTSNKVIVLFAILSLTTLALLLYYIYFEINLVWSLILCIILVILVITITLGMFKEKINNYNLKAEYDIILSNLSHYEKMYSLQRMKNHENKNNLSILRGMIDKKNKKALKYIDSLIEINFYKKNNWMEILKLIPEGGLQGILYYKFLQMDELKIKVDFSVTNAYCPSSYVKLSEKLKTEICKLLGIYLDNSIQAVNNTKVKKIFFIIDENKEYIIFKVANTFLGNVDLEKINESGYTTNEDGRGYGLAIAKEIIDKEELIDNRTQIIKDKFIQEIKIKKIV